MAGRWISKLEVGLMKAADTAFGAWPQKRPQVSSFENFQLIAHRGCFGSDEFVENTLPAFERAASFPIKGLEFDIRWTADGEPVVFHDRTFERVFRSSEKVEDLSFSQIKAKFPLVPHLREVLKAVGAKHLMIEIKDCVVDWAHGQKVLTELLEEYCPQENFHLMALKPQLFTHFRKMDPQRFLPIAKINVKALSTMALERQWGGLTCHYLTLSKACIERHHAVGQVVGVGFPASLNSLYREFHRAVDYVFTNSAAELWTQWDRGLPEPTS